MSDDEQRRITAENAKAEIVRKRKAEEASALVASMNIRPTTDMPPPINPGTLKKGDIDLQTNLFGIRMDEDKSIYKYDVEIKSDIGKKEVEFTKKGRSDHVVNDRKQKSLKIFGKAIEKTGFYRDGIVFYYDGQSLLYTTVELIFRDPAKPYETILVDGSDVSQELEVFKIIFCTIAECKSGVQRCRMSDIRRVDRDIMQTDRSAMQFVDIVTSMKALSDGGRFAVFSNGKIFPTRPDLERLPTVPMKEGKVMIPGMVKSVKLIEGPRGRNNASPAMAIDSLKVAFHVQEKVIEKAKGIFGDINKYNATEVETFANMVRGLGCNTMHEKKSRKLEIYGISKDHAAMKYFEQKLPEGQRAVTVKDYFKLKYHLDLKYPLAPLVVCKVGGQMNLYPMEVLEICPNQRVTISQTTSIQSAVATKESAVPPAARQKAILDQCNLHGFFDADQQYLKAAGLGIIDTPLRVTARLLKGPVVIYKTNEQEVNQTPWRPPRGFQFAVAASCERWALYAIVGPRDNYNRSDLVKFAEAFVKKCREGGMHVAPPSEIMVLAPPPQDKSADFPAREKIKECAYHNCNLVFFITNDFIAIHKYLKLQERYSCVVTQDLKLKTAQAVVTKNQMQTLENIVQKTNIKLGGLVNSVSVKNIVGPKVNPFAADRLVLGIGISHPPQHSMYSSTGVKLPAPSVVGYSANMANHPTEFIGDFLFQDSRKADLLLCTVEMLQNVIDRFTGAVAPDGSRTGERKKPFPKELLVFRQGVAEGFYALCIAEEIPLMRAVLKKNGAEDVKVTYIVAQKEHSVRLMQTDINAADKPSVQNIGSGVCMDSQITHPRYREFFLNSHIALQGTARTPRYTVLCDDSDLSMNELESLTHALCHNFQIINSAISLPAPLYIANRYAERGAALYSAKATDELATSEQKTRVSLEQLNDDLTYSRTPLGRARINA